jgi:hypothetical protein
VLKNAMIIIDKENFFKKILKKCFNILKRKNKFYFSKGSEDKEKNAEKEDKNESNFYYSERDSKKMQLLELQKSFEKGKIKEKDLSKEQISSLKILYHEQIKQLNTSIIRYKRKILKLYEKSAKEISN